MRIFQLSLGGGGTDQEATEMVKTQLSSDSYTVAWALWESLRPRTLGEDIWVHSLADPSEISPLERPLLPFQAGRVGHVRWTMPGPSVSTQLNLSGH